MVERSEANIETLDQPLTITLQAASFLRSNSLRSTRYDHFADKRWKLAKIYWDSGTAYDFFISLFVLHNPNRFGLRPQWAAGVRARIPEPQRQFLAEISDFLPIPLVWINRMQADPKNTRTILAELEKLAPEDRMMAFFHPAQLSPEILETFANIRTNAIVSTSDIDILRKIYPHQAVPIKKSGLQKLGNAILTPDVFGDHLLTALNTYYEVFYYEEEKRISGCIQEGLIKAQQLAENLPARDLMEKLSNGISFELVDQLKRVCLVPSYWSTPLTVIKFPDPQETVMAFGCRQENENLVPGEYVPEELVTALKALSDSSRLRILHYLNIKPETPAGLARKMRLRSPTIIYHLNILRLAKLVQIDIKTSGERRYKLRGEVVSTILSQIETFLSSDDHKSNE